MKTGHGDGSRWFGVLIAGLVFAILAGCAQAPKESAPAVDDAAKAAAEARASEVTAAMGQELMQRLLAEVTEGGHEQAVRVCSEQAPAIAASHSNDGLQIRRVTLKVRNPADTPDEYEYGKLREFERLLADGVPLAPSSEVVQGANGPELRYLKPIKIMPMCLACHGGGDDLAPGVAEMLEQNYPEDQATGYREDELRGAFSVIVDL